MRIENPNYYSIAVIFNYHSSGSSMYKYLTFITCSMIYQHRYSYVNENILIVILLQMMCNKEINQPWSWV
jgi:hypothetical protein